MNLFTPVETALNYARAGAEKTRQPGWRLLLLGVLAGFFIGVGGQAASTAAHAVENAGLSRLVAGAVFSFGLGMIVLTGAELFTGNCLIAISVLEKRASAPAMLRNWVFVYAGNFLGAAGAAAACVYTGRMGNADGGLVLFALATAAAKCALPFGTAVGLGALCNALVTVAVLMSLSAKDVPGRIMGAYLPILFFVVCGFEHSVANMYYIPAGLFSLTVPGYAAAAAAAGLDVSGLTWGRFLLRNLLPVTLGNLLGGLAVAGTVWAAWLRGAAKQAEVPAGRE